MRGKFDLEIIGVVTTYRSNGNDVLAVTIPKSAREKLNIKQGEKLVVKADGKKLIYEPTHG
jgi:AbrB family looped-hinge helix DNA binding protein